MRVPHRSLALAALALALLLGLGACTGGRLQAGNSLTCPRASFVAGTERVTRFPPNAQPAPQNAAVEIQLADLETSCRINRVRAEAALEFGILVERRNTTAVETLGVPFFVAVTDVAGNILVKHNFVSRPYFAAGVPAVTVSERIDETLPLTEGQRAVAFEILIGIQLTPAEYEYNLVRPR